MDSAGGHVGLDAHLLSRREDYRGAGVSHYIYHLLENLPQVDGSLQYTAYLGFYCETLPRAIRQSVTSLPTWRPPVRILWEQLMAPAIALREGINLWHALVNVQPLWLPIASVVTIQDLTFLICPESFHFSKRLYNRLFTRLTAYRARHIITTSQSTKDDLIAYFRLPASKITVVHAGVDSSFRPIDDAAAIEAFRRRKGLPERMILFVGTIEPRKNLVRLIEAYATLKSKAKLPHHLVIGGGKGWLYERVFAAAQELGVQESVHFPGFIPQDELVWWYNSADILAYPSLYEGFGLPPLEAMACGTPVVVSNTSSLSEVVGDAGLRVDPQDVAAIAEGMYRLLSEKVIYQEKREAGLRRARDFSWTKAARETARIYHRLLKREKVR